MDASILELLVPVLLIFLQFNLNRQINLGVSGKRLEGYARLWGLMRIVAPTDLEFGCLDSLSASQRGDLYRRLTDWYFDQGNGFFLSEQTRKIYLAVKSNLLCDPSMFIDPEKTSEAMADFDDEIRTELLVRQFSLLRESMREDLTVYADPFYGERSQIDAFLDEIDKSAGRRPRLRLRSVRRTLRSYFRSPTQFLADRRVG